MTKKEKVIRDAFAEIFMLMFNNDTDNMTLTFDFNKCIAKFKVELIELKEKKSDLDDGDLNMKLVMDDLKDIEYILNPWRK